MYRKSIKNLARQSQRQGDGHALPPTRWPGSHDPRRGKLEWVDLLLGVAGHGDGTTRFALVLAG